MSIEIKPAELYRTEVVDLLTAEKLPASDLPSMLTDFFVAVDGTRICGVVGLEVYGGYGLLRSLAVRLDYRGRGIGAQLISKIEEVAAKQDIGAIYLFTETAKDYLEHRGYEHIARMDIPEAIKASSEFTHVCPDTALAMQKSL